MDMDLKTGAVRLNFDNYDLWKETTKQILIREGLWRVIANDLPPRSERTEAWIDKDERAAATIGYLVESSQLQLIKNAATAKESWDTLKDYHVKQTSAGRVGLLKRMSRLELEEDGNVEEHLIAMDAMFDKLAEVGCEIADELKGSFILASLPESYDGFLTVMEGLDGGYSMKSLKSKLLNEFYKRQQKFTSKDEKAMKAGMKVFHHQDRRIPGLPSDHRVCFECGKPGHIRKGCQEYLSRLAREQLMDERFNKKVSNAKVAVQEETGRSVCFSAVEHTHVDHQWIIDSGASCHMTSDRKFFTSIKSQKDVIKLADGKELESSGIGHCIIIGVGDDGKATEVRLKDVLYVPGLNNNLISVSMVTKSGARVEFGSSDCFVQKDKRIVLVGTKINGVYKLKGKAL